MISSSFIILAFVYAIWYSFPIFFVALLEEFHWNRSTVSGAFSLFVIIHSIIGPFVGSMVDRFGPRRVIILGSLFLGTGLGLCSLIQTWSQFYIFFGIITAIGVASAGWIPNTTLIQLWFKAKRGLAMGVVSSGIGIGILVCVPSFQFLINRVGWRTTYNIVAIVVTFVVISMAIVFLRKPSQLTQYDSEKNVSSTDIKDRLVANREWASRIWTVRRAITTKQFWLISFSYLLVSFMAQGILTHQVAFFVDQGLKTLFASYIVGMVGLVSIGGKILWGTLSDKIGREVTYTLGIVCSICGIIFLIIFGISPSSILPYFYALFFGMGYAVQAALPPLIVADFFEGKTYGSIFGTLMIFHGLGGAFGAWFAGFLYDQVENYFPAFIIMIACAFFSCLSIWWAAPRKIRIVPGKTCNIGSPGFS